MSKSPVPLVFCAERGLIAKDEFKVSQSSIHAVQDQLAELPQVDGDEQHFFADGVYGRIMKLPADTWVIGKPHKTNHLCVLLKGALQVTQDDGSVVIMRAPNVYVAPAGKKKLAYVLEDVEFMNVHATETQDLEVIESNTLMTDEEHRAFWAGVDSIEGTEPVKVLGE